MADLINDGSLVGFWPLNEPSGASLFKNYSPAYAKYPSGISFDMHVAVADILSKEEAASVWPGGQSFINPESGVLIQGYTVQGHWKLNTDSSPLSKYLVVGGGGRPQAEQCLSVPVAESGFTVGIWAYPNSNGYLNAADSAAALDGNDPWDIVYGRAHALIGQFSAYIDNAGWYMGVSGHLDRGAQYDEGVLGAGNTLGAYLSLTKAPNTSADLLLETPIESGRYTHLTMTYRYIDGSVNELVLYKDGHVAASGTTNDNLTLSNTSLISNTNARALAIGVCDPEAATSFANHYDKTAGWGNLVSGVYHFRRVLHEGEILELHQRGGLVADENALLPTADVAITDSDLIGYFPHFEPGFADISREHRPWISNLDMGYITNGPLFVPGPHGGGYVFNDGVNDYIAHAATSGLCYDLLSQGSWTISMDVGALNNPARDDIMLFSWGSVTNITAATSLPISSPPTESTAGICCTVSGITNQHRYVIEVYSTGDVTQTPNIIIFNIDGLKEHYDGAACNLSLAYDDSTKGIAAYLNGVQQGSGTLNHSLSDHLRKITGSGFPLLFGNGIIDKPSSSNHGVHTGGGYHTMLGATLLAKRALISNELRAIAVNGIDFTSLYRTPHDPRLMGYWPASDFKIDDVIVEDRARCWQEASADLVRGDSFAKQERWYDKDHNEAAGTIFDNQGIARYNQFGFRTLPPELASYGNLGITSGTFTVKGSSAGTAFVTDAADTRSAIGNLSTRFKPTTEQRDGSCQNIAGEFVISYEVTPSGDIPPTIIGLGNPAAGDPTFNSALHFYQDTGIADTRSYLTTLEAGSGSGVSIVWLGENNTPLVSGNLPYGVPSRVLLHGKFDLPSNFNGIAVGATPYSVGLWIDGELVHQRQMTANTAALWTNGFPDSTSDIHSLTFGGIVGNPGTHATQFTAIDSGLGEIYLRNIFVMRGVFFKDEIAALAASGIQTPTIAGYSNSKTTTQVSIADDNLVTYYRFSGFSGNGSGTSDLSTNANHMFGAQQNIVELDATQSQGAFYLRAFPGPFEASDLGVHCSGFTYSSRQVAASAPHLIPPFMASGARFNSPQNGFSVGFFYIKKLGAVTSNFDTIVSYGCIPTTVTNTDINPDYGWAIGMDQSDNMRMVMTLKGDTDPAFGHMYFNPTTNAIQSGQMDIGMYGDGGRWVSDPSLWTQYSLGHQRVPRLDSWTHYCWTYDATLREVVYYVNGDIVDRQTLKDYTIPNTPSEFARYLTFYQHTSSPWQVAATAVNDYDGAMTDFFYFDDTLTAAEVRYISQNGIDSATGTPTSGIIGGFVHGQDVGSGLIGGYSRGQTVGSGLIGGFVPGSIVASGLVGGFVSGIVFGDGTIGGFVQGLDTVSGIMAGYILGLDIGSGMIAGYVHGQEVGSGLFGGMILGAQMMSGVMGGYMHASDIGSGLIGGFMLGSLQGNFEFDANFTVEVLSAKDFDAQLEIAKTVSSDFDAKLVIFQNEIPPLVDIIVPDATVTGLAPPFNQYFVGVASGQQGKTITQTRWNFGDLTPNMSVSVSGSDYYPIQHYFASSGFFTVKFEAIDSDGMHASTTRIVNAASGIDPVLISLSGVPRSGNAGLIVDFTTDVDILPPGVSIVARLLQFDDGQTTTAFNPTHIYTEPGTYRPVWIIRDSRGVIWSDTLEAGPDVS